MSIVDMIRALVGGSGDPFKGLDPDDIEMYWKLEHAISSGEREGGDALKQRLSQYGLRSKSQAENVMAAYYQRHGQKAEFRTAATQVQLRAQLGNYQPPA